MKITYTLIAVGMIAAAATLSADARPERGRDRAGLERCEATSGARPGKDAARKTRRIEKNSTGGARREMRREAEGECLTEKQRDELRETTREMRQADASREDIRAAREKLFDEWGIEDGSRKTKRTGAGKRERQKNRE